jgi:hypothetical protein
VGSLGSFIIFMISVGQYKTMSSPQTTPIRELLGNDHPNVNPALQDPSAQFGNLPFYPESQQQQQQFNPPLNDSIYAQKMAAMSQLPNGPSQGISAPNIMGKEFFGLKETDYKTLILVFAIILILSSGIFYSVLRPYVPGAVGQDGKVTLIGSLIAAVVGTILFVLVKAVGKF